MKMNCTNYLLIVSVISLIVQYLGVAVESLNFSAWGIELSGIKITNQFAVAMLVPFMVFVLLIGHLWSKFDEVAEKYTLGYGDAPKLGILIQESIALAAKTNKYGLQPLNSTACLFRKQFDLGKWKESNGTLSESVIIYPSIQEHIESVFCGLKAIIVSENLWMKVYIPIVVGVLALASFLK